ncbi:peroxiredoxin [Caldivirga maquilingensis]|uniref:thioredoxin-dependent peroxiredoxin n=1 Tax=Caldivirga maquilingensis (strain ATCC 700844 / DSM 13496 / JCM 10307 / IC-167) TaxID=397948 RepID=A8MAP0_CALMQ|nr:peroxiredoxin [Caldivirga maquilingensis]ABW01076.1 alkyl hydroperoxide reductase/ Thiol specific antioxidant/ Mal allergen [Caldivirga maquilingensis IC-167]
MVKEGEEAPNFELSDHNGSTIRLSDYRGRWIVLYFFPKAFTPGCTIETKEFSRLWDELEKMGVTVFGISTDSVETQRKFAEKYGVKFKLLSDHDKNASKAYGVLGLIGMAERVTFIINPEGKVVKVIKGVKPDEHPVKALEYLRAVIKVNK